jgi:hypothetical protein
MEKDHFDQLRDCVIQLRRVREALAAARHQLEAVDPTARRAQGRTSH